jgi:H+/gluconate symporter-like permease|tara:strand:+ start:303 stop:482 length:180 start_codon:yes stop_codon:yes gene_type:complete
MVMFILGLCVGIIISFIGAMIWGYQLSKKEDELNQQLIKEFQDKYMETQDNKFYKRYES